MYKDVLEKKKRKNTLLFDRDSKSLEELMKTIRLSTHQALILWAFECVTPMMLDLKTRYKNDTLDNAFVLVRQWAKGEVKMAVAKKAILEVHALAKTTSNKVDQALFHAVGQGLAVVHVETHAVGLVIYELSAIVLKQEDRFFESDITHQINTYIEILKSVRKT